MREIPALILGDDPVNVLGVARNLGRLGIPVIRIGSSENKTLCSRYIVSCHVYDDLEDCSDYQYVDRLLTAVKKLGGRAVVFPLSDIHVLRVSSNRIALSADLFLHTPELTVVETLVNKRKFYESMRRYDMPHPASMYPETEEEFLAAGERIGYPVFLKPEISPLFARRFKVKGLITRNADEMSSNYRALKGSRMDVVVQEIIPGSADCMHGCAGVVTPDRFASFCYQRIREFPEGFGCGSLLKSVPDFSNQTRLAEYFANIGYSGIFDAEFKRDPRDQQFKMIEINARSWWQNSLPTSAGFNIIKTTYDFAIGRPVERSAYQSDVLWMHLYNDFHAGRSSGMGLGSWLWGLKSVSSFDVWADDDKGPMWAFLADMISRKAKKLTGGGDSA